MERCPCHGERWASPEGWRPDLNRPGYLYHPDHSGWLRDKLGHWYDSKDVDGVRREVEEASQQFSLAQSGIDPEIIERVKRSAKRVLGDA